MNRQALEYRTLSDTFPCLWTQGGGYNLSDPSVLVSDRSVLVSDRSVLVSDRSVLVSDRSPTWLIMHY